MSTAASPRDSEAARTAPPCILVMGVSGSGKSAVAAALAARLGCEVVDGDDLHAPEAVERMRSGTPLRDEDRWPWLDRIGRRLAEAGEGGLVVSCSALRRAYRQRLRAACPALRFVFLDGDEAVLRARLAARQGHFMPASLLSSQLQALERPGADEPDVVTLDVAPTLPEVVARALDALGRGTLERRHERTPGPQGTRP